MIAFLRSKYVVTFYQTTENIYFVTDGWYMLSFYMRHNEL
jgi:hypothetical protein